MSQVSKLLKLSFSLSLILTLILSLCACPGAKRSSPRPAQDEPKGCERVGQRCQLTGARSKSASMGVCSPGGPGEGLSCVPQH